MTLADVPDLPRFQKGARSQRLLTTLLGDYWFGRGEHIPSAALVQLLGEFGIGPAGSRAAIQRLAQRGFLSASRSGRETAYGVPLRSREGLRSNARGLFEDPWPKEWDGIWTVVTYSVPETEQTARRQLRETLRGMHFGNLYDAVWVQPGTHPKAVTTLKNLVEAGQLTAFETSSIPDTPGPALAEAAFNLESVRDHYRRFVARWDPEASSDTGSGENSALQTRTALMSDWRALVRNDPRLPRQLLGPCWPGDQAYEVCSRIYDALGPRAETAFRKILESHDPALAELTSHHTFTDWASRLDPS